MASDAAFRAQIDGQVRANIAQYGVHIFGTFTAQGQPWLHTVGLLGRYLPELVMIGLPHHQGHEALNAVARWCLDREDDLVVPGQSWTVDAYNRDLMWKAATVSRAWCEEHMNKMRRYYPGRWRPGLPGSVLQVLWPDANGAHPSPLHAMATQPLLAEWQR